MTEDDKAAIESRIDVMFPSRRWVPMSKAIWPAVEIRMSEVEAAVLENVKLRALVEAAYFEAYSLGADEEEVIEQWKKSDAHRMLKKL